MVSTRNMYDIIRKTFRVLAKGPLYIIGLVALMLIDISLSTSLCISLCSYSVTNSIPIFFIVATILFIIQFMLLRSVPGRTSGRRFQFSSLMSQYSTRHVVMLFQLVLAAFIGVILL